jgi:hypothetical protein
MHSDVGTGELERLQQVCVIIDVGDWEVSIAIDDSAGAMDKPRRDDIRVFDSKGGDVTAECFLIEAAQLVPATAANVEWAIQYARRRGL